MKRSELKRSTKPMKRSAMQQKSELARSSTLKASKPIERKISKVSSKKAAPMKSRGMKGRPPTADEQRFMDRAGALPCMACEIDGWENNMISLHHIDGRTKPGAHYRVISLCAEHHQQDDTDPLQRPSVHGRKAMFTARYGTERELLALLHERLGFAMPE